MADGRKNVPEQIKKLSGTARADRAKAGVEFDVVSEVPKPEPWLSTRGKKNFKLICEMLIKKQLLTTANAPLVCIMAEEFATYEEACRVIKREGKVMDVGDNGYKQQSPWLGIKNQALKNYKEITSLFGMDPVSAQKINGPTNKAIDDFERLKEKYNDD